jgi:hypothetical protein
MLVAIKQSVAPTLRLPTSTGFPLVLAWWSRVLHLAAIKLIEFKNQSALESRCFGF